MEQAAVTASIIYGSVFSSLVGQFVSFVVGRFHACLAFGKDRFMTTLTLSKSFEDIDEVFIGLSTINTATPKHRVLTREYSRKVAKDALSVPASSGVWYFFWFGWIPVWYHVYGDPSVRNITIQAMFVDADWIRCVLLPWIVELGGGSGRHPDKKRNTDNVTVVMWSTRGYGWRTAQNTGRRLSSVVMPDAMRQAVVEDIQWFLDAEDLYRELGLRHSRSYLLKGPPGTGKTSFITAIATHFGLQILFLPVGILANLDIVHLYEYLKVKTLIVIEDIDRTRSLCIDDDTLSSDKKADKDDGLLTMLLQFLDGLMTPSGGTVFIMTANEPEKIKPVVFRHGRVCMTIAFEPPHRDEYRTMYLRFFPDEPDAAAAYADSVPTGTSMAAVQCHLLPSLRTGLPPTAFVSA